MPAPMDAAPRLPRYYLAAVESWFRTADGGLEPRTEPLPAGPFQTGALPRTPAIHVLRVVSDDTFFLRDTRTERTYGPVRGKDQWHDGLVQASRVLTNER